MRVLIKMIGAKHTHPTPIMMSPLTYKLREGNNSIYHLSLSQHLALCLTHRKYIILFCGINK